MCSPYLFKYVLVDLVVASSYPLNNGAKDILSFFVVIIWKSYLKDFTDGLFKRLYRWSWDLVYDMGSKILFSQLPNTCNSYKIKESTNNWNYLLVSLANE